jgi:8-oxo-dGTP pyrophosphatase MutT (NUDIX family)
MARPYTVAPHLRYFNIPLAEFTAARPEFESFGVGGYIFSDESATPRVLLLQRAMTDSMPGCWEGPGGAYEPGIDGTLLDGVAREVLEETGLHVSRLVELVAVDSWTHTRRNGSKFRIAKYSFIVEVYESVRQSEMQEMQEMPVQLMASEHRAFDWATEEDVRNSLQSGGKYQLPLPSTGHQAPNILRSFELYRELQGKSSR